MHPNDAATQFPATVVFPDVDPEILAREDASPMAVVEASRLWNIYLRKFLPVPGYRAGDRKMQPRTTQPRTTQPGTTQPGTTQLGEIRQS